MRQYQSFSFFGSSSNLNPKKGTRASHRESTNSIGWESRKPKSSARRSMRTDCFLVGPPDYKYPICAKGSHTVDCQGLMSAHQRATLILRDPRKKSTKAKEDARRAKKTSFRLAKRYGCAWTATRTDKTGKKRKSSKANRFG